MFAVSEALHLHMSRSKMGNLMYATSCMLTVVCIVYLLAVANLCTFSAAAAAA